MPWKQITLDLPDALKDAVIGELSEMGAAGVWESQEPKPGHTQLVAYFDHSVSLRRIQQSIGPIFERASSVSPTIRESPVADRDWGEEWKRSWSSFAIGNSFFVIPSWIDDACPDDRLPIRIDPGQAFGTGTHETTQLTLEALERWVEPSRTVLDLGTGSGILAIACRMLGARAVFACDIDPVAMEVARENTLRNSAGNCGLMCGSIDAVATESVDLLLCNLTADAIAEVFSEIHRALRPRGVAVFSGILDTQREQILEFARRFGHDIIEESSRGEWIALVTLKNGH